MIAGVGAGHWATLEDALAIIHEVEVVAPDPALGPVYERTTRRMEALYPVLQPCFAQMAKEQVS